MYIYFTRVGFRDGCRFKCLQEGQEGRIYTLARFVLPYPSNDCDLVFQIYEGSTYAGVIEIEYHPPMPRIKRPEFCRIDNLMLEENYQSLYLGTLLVYIANIEVRLNGGDHIYVQSSRSNRGFFQKTCFIPNPDNTDSRNEELSENISHFGKNPHFEKMRYMWMTDSTNASRLGFAQLRERTPVTRACRL